MSPYTQFTHKGQAINMDQRTEFTEKNINETTQFDEPQLYNLDAEADLIGAILLDNAALDKVSDFLTANHFYNKLHQRIYTSLELRITRGEDVTPVTLKTDFQDEQPLETGDPEYPTLTVPQYLVRLVTSAYVPSAKDYGRAIQKLYKRRKLSEIGLDIHYGAANLSTDADENTVIEDGEDALYKLAEKDKYGGGFIDIKEAVAQSIEMANNAYTQGDGLAGISTGFRGLDNKLGGLQKSDLIILAGRPSMGKTALATNITYNIGKDKKRVAFFSLEMSSEQLATRIMSSMAKLPSEKIRRGMIDKDDFRKLADAARALQELPIHIEETGGLSIAQLASRARRLHRQNNLDVIVVDYTQLMAGKKGKSDNRVQEISEITSGLKALAKELNVPVIALSQLSRECEKRTDKRPQLSDLRDSGSIEQDADVVMFVYREEYYVAREAPSETDVEATIDWQDKMAKVEGKAEVIIGKQRHGPTGTVNMLFNGNYTQFEGVRA